MAYLTQEQLESLNFKSLGENVQISYKVSIYNHESISIGSNTVINDFCLLKGPLTIGSYVHIAPYCLISATDNEIIIGDFTGLAYRVSVFSSTDDYSGESLTGPLIPKYFKNISHGTVDIQRQCLIGTGSVIMPSVTIAEGCSVGAMSFMNKSTLPWGMYAGAPAKRIKDRSKDLLKLEEAFLK